MSLLGRDNDKSEEKWGFLHFSSRFIKMAEIIILPTTRYIPKLSDFLKMHSS